jgi:hypothetical protein
VKQKLRNPPGAGKARSSARDRQAEQETANTPDALNDSKLQIKVRAELRVRSSSSATKSFMTEADVLR